MRGRNPVTLFPFLSVLVSTMGVLSFLAVTFLLFVRQEQAPPIETRPVEVSWVGAPEHVRPLLVECRADRLIFHPRNRGAAKIFTLSSLEREVEIVKEIERRGLARLGASPDPYRLWLFMKSAIQAETRLAGSFTRAVHEQELYNLSGEGRRRFIQFYPILLVYPEGVRTYEVGTFLVETTTRLAVGLEPFLNGWELPYREHTSQAGAGAEPVAHAAKAAST